MAIQDDDDRLITDTEAAEFLGVQPQTLRRWRWAGNSPRYVRLSRSPRGAVRYTLRALREWVREHEAASTSGETWTGPPPACASVGGTR